MLTMKFSDLVNIEQLRSLCESFTALTGAVTAILDLEGNILVATGWQDICTRFHRVHPLTTKRCLESDTILAGQLSKGETYNVYQCKNGLVDVAVPIIIEGEHLANFFTGQFFYSTPDKEFFIRQAEKFGFEKESYLAALGRAPIFNEDRVRAIVEFFTQLAHLIGAMGHARRCLEKANQELQGHHSHLEGLVSELRENEEKYRLLTEHAEEVIWILDPETLHYLYVSPSVYKLRGYTSEEVISEAFDNGLLPEDAVLWRERTRRRLDAFEAGADSLDTFFTDELEQLCKDGSIVWTEVVTNWYLNKKSSKYEIRGVTRDITQRKKTEAELKLAHDAEKTKSEQLLKSEKILRESEKHIRVLFNSGSDPIFVYEIDSISGAPFNHFIEVNDVACSRLGYSREALLLMRPEDIVAHESVVHPAPNFKIAYDRKGVYESTYRAHDGHPIPVEINAHVFDLYDKTLVFAMARDITERKKAEADLKLAHSEIALRNAELEQISITDRLTGLFNRRKLDDVLFQEMERVMRYDQNLSVILVDIDKFKSVNDLYGHLTGDIVLTAISGVLQHGVRKTDIPGRWGGEEFLVICPNTNLEGAMALAEHLRQMVAAYDFDVVGKKTCSFGVAQMAKDEPINSMIGRTDLALYRAKESGRNRVEADIK
jgi:diguanylate cyclase (GGDEF)-like protein/PAS domain S-box-containing protein